MFSKFLVKDFSVNKTIKPGLNQYVYDFSVDYNIVDIQKYLMEKHGIK